MNESQQATVLRSVALSSGFLPLSSPTDRHVAFSVLEDFKVYEGRIATSIAWLHQERHVLDHAVNVTIPIKLYALTILENFLQSGSAYQKLNPNDRLALRHAVLVAAKQIAPLSLECEERVLGNKIASLLAALMLRDFPQHWSTFFGETFESLTGGGLWCNAAGEGYHNLGVKICLECLKLVTEDTTDSDFNAKISTARRNDVLIGLNEVSSHFLKLIFGVLEHVAFLVQSKANLHNMRNYLLSTRRTLAQMTPDESNVYTLEIAKSKQATSLICDCLVTISRFCNSMPIDWMLGQPDFSSALLHLLRVPGKVQILAVTCLEQLLLRKLDFSQWMKILEQLPNALAEANGLMNAEQEELLLEQQVSGSGGGAEDALARQLPYHRAVSRMLAAAISNNISHITTNKQIMSSKGKLFEAFQTILRLLVDLLHHPSGRICSEQTNTWILLLRDPQISKAKMVRPYAEELITCYLNHMVKIRWEDVDNRTHARSELMEASYDDEDDYAAWNGEFRSRCSMLFRFLGNVTPDVASTMLNKRIQELLGRHGNGAPHDHLHPGNNQLTPKSEAVVQLEGIYHPLDTALSGIPQWALEDDANESNKHKRRIRTEVLKSLSELSNAVVTWNPTHVYLKFRRAQLMEALKHYWIYGSTGLLQGIDSLLNYLGSDDDWNPGGGPELSGEIVSLRKKSGVALVNVAKKVPHHLVPWISQLSEAVRRHLSSTSLLPPNRMHLYEFLSCVATAVEDPVARANFISGVLSDAFSVLESPEFQQKLESTDAFMAWLGISGATSSSTVTDPANVQQVTTSFERAFSALNQILSVGKRCHEANKNRPLAGIPLQPLLPSDWNTAGRPFPDEGPVSIQDLAMNDPFIPLWPRILPALLQIMDVSLRIWHPSNQAALLQDNLQRYVVAISDDEAYLSKVHDNKSGGVFGEGGTAGSVVAGTDRRDLNIVPRWSGWFNELRNTCFQMLGLLAGQRALFAPEVASLYPRLVSVVANPDHLLAMENRHITQYMKQFIEILLLACPATLYKTHLSPIIMPLIEHMEYRLDKNWDPVLIPSSESLARPLYTADCMAAAALAARGGDEWFSSYYGRAGLFVGDLDVVTAEAAVDKSRVELSRTFSDVIQAGLALKGDWALVLATQAKEEAATKKNDPSIMKSGPKARFGNGEIVNADGSPRKMHQAAINARKLLRISGLCHFLLLEEEKIAGHLTLSIIQSLSYPDAYTVRRCARICHRILETVAWSPQYTPMIANRMFVGAVTNVVAEPRWMVGVEWDMINLVRDIYCRLVLGQVFQPGGQGPGLQQTKSVTNQFEQAKCAADPLKGGGVLVAPSDLPRSLLASLPGIGPNEIQHFESDMKQKRAAKDQKDTLRDFLRVAAKNSQYLDTGRAGGDNNSIFGRADLKESLLNQKIGAAIKVPDLKEKLVTQTMVKKQEQKRLGKRGKNNGPEGLAAFAL